MSYLFSVSLFWGAFLLFGIQPMVAKALLPIYGGAPSVWTVCVLFFQLALFAAYTYVAVLGKLKSFKVWRIIHSLVFLISLFFIPLYLNPSSTSKIPEIDIIKNLLLCIGFPLLILGASAPLLQFAYSQTKAKYAKDPYYLYSASNAGSLLALLLYPFLFERFFGLQIQFLVWNGAYIIYILMMLIILYRYDYLDFSADISLRLSSSDPLSLKRILYWIMLSAIPCSLMMGVTLYISTDIAATPLFWIIPLALYLLTYILAFSNNSKIPFAWFERNALFFVIFIILGFILSSHQLKAWQHISFNLVGFFVLALLCHRKLFLTRPSSTRLPLYYWCIALGGLLAGIFNGIIASNLFLDIYEYPIALLIGLLMLPEIALNKHKFSVTSIKEFKNLWLIPISICITFLLITRLPHFNWYTFSLTQITTIVILALVIWAHTSHLNLVLSLAVLLIVIYLPSFQENNIFLQKRNFFGVKKVIAREGIRAFMSQSTLHGLQEPLDQMYGISSYYGALEPVLSHLKTLYPVLNVQIIGLGIGTLACQFRQNDSVNIIEIDKQVIDIAHNESFFNYLSHCPVKAKVTENDGRLAMEKISTGSQDIIIMDAFSSDAIPVHLITKEAFELYSQKLKKEGVIIVNLSNRHLNLYPVIIKIGQELDMMVFGIYHQGDPSKRQYSSQWALLTKNENLLMQLHRSNWHFMTSQMKDTWTDDYSNLIPLLK